MHKTICTGFLFLCSLGFAAGQGPAEAMAVIDKAIAANGGVEKLAKTNVQTFKSKGVMTAAGQKIEYRADYVFVMPDKFRFDMKAEVGGQKMEIAAATDGKVAWESAMGMTREMEKKKAAEFLRNVYSANVCQLTPLKDKAYTLTLLEGDKDHARVKVASKGRPDVELFFDKKTGLLAKSLTTAWDEFTNKDVPQEVAFTGYRDQDGCKVFDKMTIARDGKQFQVEEVSDWKFPGKVDEKLFAKP